MNIIIQGKAWVFGDNINTDIISPPQYMELSIAEAARYAMSAVRPEFASEVKPGDILVAGANFGSGSSRETSPLTLRHLGIRAVVAKSFARIFYRNCINLGIPAIECPQCGEIKDSDLIKIEVEKGVISNLASSAIYLCTPLPPNILEMIEVGGLVPYLVKMQKENKNGAH
jgi:3-isopropylmalate/(R)-2-methylmalate dehydratase small subunit